MRAIVLVPLERPSRSVTRPCKRAVAEPEGSGVESSPPGPLKPCRSVADPAVAPTALARGEAGALRLAFDREAREERNGSRLDIEPCLVGPCRLVAEPKGSGVEPSHAALEACRSDVDPPVASVAMVLGEAAEEVRLAFERDAFVERNESRLDMEPCLSVVGRGGAGAWPPADRGLSSAASRPTAALDGSGLLAFEDRNREGIAELGDIRTSAAGRTHERGKELTSGRAWRKRRPQEPPAWF